MSPENVAEYRASSDLSAFSCRCRWDIVSGSTQHLPIRSLPVRVWEATQVKLKKDNWRGDLQGIGRDICPGSPEITILNCGSSVSRDVYDQPKVLSAS